MIYEKINLKDFYPLSNNTPLIAYCPDNYSEINLDRVRPAVIICPGGAYQFLSERESEPIALSFLSEDICCFVLKYSVGDKLHYPDPFAQAFAAIAYVRKNAAYYHVNPDKISICGFSAGGHLAASVAAYWNEAEFADTLKVKTEDIKVNGCILGYPVISSVFGHQETFDTFSKGNKELAERFSIDKHVTSDFAKTFIWHTAYDPVVHVKNSLSLAEALRENNVFFELHIYPVGGHGESLANRIVYNDKDPYYNDDFINEIAYNTQWVKQAAHFIKEYV